MEKQKNSTGATEVSIYKAHNDLKQLLGQRVALLEKRNGSLSDTRAKEIHGFITTLLYEVAIYEHRKVKYCSDSVPVNVSRCSSWYDFPDEVLERAAGFCSGRTYNFIVRELNHSTELRDQRLQTDESFRRRGYDYQYPEFEKHINQYMVNTEGNITILNAILELGGISFDCRENRLKNHILENGCVKSKVCDMLKGDGINITVANPKEGFGQRDVLIIDTPFVLLSNGQYNRFEGTTTKPINTVEGKNYSTKVLNEIVYATRAITLKTSADEIMFSRNEVVTGIVSRICPEVDILSNASYEYDINNDLLRFTMSYHSTSFQEVFDFLDKHAYKEKGINVSSKVRRGCCGRTSSEITFKIDLTKSKKFDGASYTLSAK